MQGAQGLQQMSQTALNPISENVYHPATTGAGAGFAQGIAQGAGNAAMNYFASGGGASSSSLPQNQNPPPVNQISPPQSGISIAGTPNANMVASAKGRSSPYGNKYKNKFMA
jgi:hypothetical protein